MLFTLIVCLHTKYKLCFTIAAAHTCLDWKNFINIKNSAKKQQNSTIHNDTE